MLLSGIIVAMAGLTRTDTPQNLLRSHVGIRNELFLYLEVVSIPEWIFSKIIVRQRLQATNTTKWKYFHTRNLTTSLSFSDQDIGHDKFLSGMSPASQQLRRTIYGQWKSWSIFCRSISCFSWSSRKELILNSGRISGWVSMLYHLGNGWTLRISRSWAFFELMIWKSFVIIHELNHVATCLGHQQFAHFMQKIADFRTYWPFLCFLIHQKFLYLFITQINFLLLNNKYLILFSLHTP